MHRIQKFIIAQLMEEPTLRYTDMRPKTMEAGQFMYHLKKLMDLGYVAKKDDGRYTLSASGRLFVDKFDADALKPLEPPRLAALLVCEDPVRGNLYVRRGVHPFAGWAGFPFIDIPIDYEGSLCEFVGKQLKRDTNIAWTITHRADGYVRLLRNGELEGNLMAHVMVATNPKGELSSQSRSVEFFYSQQPADKIERMLPSSMYILDRLKQQSDFFFFEYQHNIEE